MTTDTIDALKADMINDAPDAVQAALDARCCELILAAFRLAETWQDSGDPWAGIHAITSSVLVLQDAQKRLEHDIEQQSVNRWRASNRPRGGVQ